MEQNLENWTKGAKIAFGSYIVVLLGMLVGNVIDIFNVLGALTGPAVAVGLITAAADIVYVVGIGKMKNNAPSDRETSAAKKVFAGAILAVIAVLIGIIPLMPGFIARILNIIAFFLMLAGFNRMRKSEVLARKAARGASLLFGAMLVLMFGFFLGFIPVAGGVIEAVLCFISVLLGIIGWFKLSHK